MKTALLISTYNWETALNLVFKGLKQQTVLPDEILIADDGSREETGELIRKFQTEISVPVKHFWQEDKGFRKALILNKAIAGTDAGYIIQTDGDCIPEKHFIEDHLSHRLPNTYLFGSRVNIRKEYMNAIIESQKANFNFWSNEIKNKTRAIRSGFLSERYQPTHEISSKIRGCNLSFWRKDLIAINGYNEDMEGWGREDSDMIIRLHNNHINGRRLRYAGIVFHLYHKESSREHLEINDKIEKAAKAKGTTWCENGISKYLL